MSDTAVSYGMSRGRLWVAHVAIALLLGGSLTAIGLAREVWPFSPYEMFSQVRPERTLTRLRVFGITQNGDEIPLQKPEYIEPFDQSRLARAFSKMRGPDRQVRYRAALADCAQRYESHRLAGRHHGPPLVGARLYELFWTVDDRARNVDHPDRRTLMGEWRFEAEAS